MSRRKKLPDEPFEVAVTSLLENGRGGAQWQDRKLEIHGALPGETVLARHLFGRRFHGQADTLALLNRSPDRVEPACPNFGTCSACTMQHIATDVQLDFKQQFMLDHLRRLGDVEPETVLLPLVADLWHYRRKARLSVRHVEAKGRVLVGFRERDGRFVTDMQECHILPATIAAQLGPLAELIAAMDAVKTIPQIEVCCGDEACALIFRHMEPLSEADLGRLMAFSSNTAIKILLQPKGPDSVMALDGNAAELSYAIPGFGLDFQFEPLDFVQVNAVLNQKMVQQAIELLQPGANDHVLDLFCGLGNFSLPIARSAGHVTGVEGDEGLVARAGMNAQRNCVKNVSYVCADLYSSIPAAGWAAGPYDKVLLDPPRSGAEPVLPAIGASGAARVVYVSCNPKTLASDAGLLVRQHGFTLVSAGVMDMFPHTSHIESMALFER